MKVLIIEPENNGHHFILYINKIVNELKKKNYQIDILTSKKTINSASYNCLADVAGFEEVPRRVRGRLGRVDHNGKILTVACFFAGTLTLSSAQSFLYQLLRGVAYCHHHRVLHR